MDKVSLVAEHLIQQPLGNSVVIAFSNKSFDI